MPIDGNGNSNGCDIQCEGAGVKEWDIMTSNRIIFKDKRTKVCWDAIIRGLIV